MTPRTHLLLPLLVSVALVLLAAGCGPRQETDPGQDIEARVGDEFTLVLDSNVTTGYQWQLGEALDESVVTLVGSEYEGPGGLVPAVGAGGQEVWTFKAVGAGTAQIPLVYVRPWEESASPVDSRTFTVVVK